ncbi:MAG: tetratricopeptide repeat protein [Leptospiraceae bacterium]|nr:tetratricopeptide repeat protein [Leptospiraceae bacterium]MDW7976925.1 tetratricopeptide repeat protein [Leptospiraceae bacterium]
MRFFVFLVFISFSSLFSLEERDHVYVFESYQALRPKKMILVGEIKSKVKSTKTELKDEPIKEYDVRKDVVLVKLYNKKGIRVGQKLYIVYKDLHQKYRNALLVGEIIVNAILYHPLYGLALLGEGNLLRVREGYFVVRDLESENLEKAHLIKRKGDSEYYRGNTEKAIEEYTRALQQDNTLVDAHFALGRVYYSEYLKKPQDVMLRNALKEFEIAWDLRNQFHTNKDKYEYYKLYYSSLLEMFLSFDFQEAQKEKKAILDSFIRMKEIAEECQIISDDLECKKAKAIPLYYEYRFYSDEATKEQRQKFDQLRGELGQLLKSIEDEENQRQYLKVQEYLAGEVKYIEPFIDLPQYEYVFIHFYFELYKELDSFKQWKEKQKLKEILRTHIQRYFLFTKDNPKYHQQNQKILFIKNALESN